MCRWYCTSEGGSTNLRCLHCGKGYCAACLHGDGGKMESLVKCSTCGKKPRTKEAGTRGAWKAGGDAPMTSPAASSTGVQAGTRAVTGASDADTVARFAANLRPEATPARSAGAEIMKSSSPTKPKAERKLAGFGVRLTEGQLQEKLASIYESYIKMAPTATAMDNVKWKKCLTDLGLIDRSVLTSTEIDMIFTRVKQKGERRLAFTGFYDAMVMCAQKKFPDAENDQAALSQLLAVAGVAGEMDGGAASSPAVAASEEKKVSEAAPVSPQPPSPNPPAAKKPPKSPTATASAGGSSIFDRLTDTSKYTGAHKARFGQDGKGLGRAGRDDATTTDDLSKIVRGGGMSGSMAPSGPVVPAREISPERKAPAAPAKKKAAASSGGGSIFDRLTDTSKYTGAHKARFDSSGKGRGLSGRDGGINQNPTASLANMTRRS